MSRRFKLPCDEMRRLYEDERMTTVLLAFRYRCSAATVAKHLRLCGIRVRDARFVRRHIPADELLRLYLEEKLPLARIAEHFGVSISTLYNRLKEANAPRRGRWLVRELATVRYRAVAVEYRL
jgi:DNA invertase Pin-like site-specific DNA recombinase